MPGTFLQIYIQYVFAVKGLQNFLLKGFEQEVYKYITGIIREKEQKPFAANGMPDHILVLVGLRPVMRISDLIRVKNNSTNFINGKGRLNQKFSWQEGYGAFSYSESGYGKVQNPERVTLLNK
jgi:REP element-mobilizing transposase RayT